MDYQDINQTIRKTYMNVLLANEAEALEAAKHMAEWLGADVGMVDTIQTEVAAFTAIEPNDTIESLATQKKLKPAG